MAKSKPTVSLEPRVVPLAEVAAVKAEIAKGLPKHLSISVRKGGRGCPDGHAVVSIVEAP